MVHKVTYKAVDLVMGWFDRDFAQKVRWRIKYDRNPLFVIVQDKYRVREYAATRGVKTAPLLYVTDKPETIPFDSLSGSYFIKANHGWGWNILGKDDVLYLHGDGSQLLQENNTVNEEKRLTREACVALCQDWLTQRYGRPRHLLSPVGTEWAYQEISPRIIVEKCLIARDGGELNDYRFYTFDGVVKAINIGSRTYRREKLNVFFYPDWSEIKLTVYKDAVPDPLPPKPENVTEMIQIAERLGNGLDFIRVDMYDTTDGLVLGEMTVYPERGARRTPTACPKFNRWLGSQWIR